MSYSTSYSPPIFYSPLQDSFQHRDETTYNIVDLKNILNDRNQVFNQPPPSSQLLDEMDEIQKSDEQVMEELINSFMFRKDLFSIIQGGPPPPPPLSQLLFLSSIDVQTTSSKELGEIDIPEDSIYRKLLACIPIIGIIPTVLNEHSLRKKINQTKDSNYCVRLISVKNHYKISSIIRELLSLALIVSGIALNILSWPIGVGAGIIVAGCVAYNAYGILKNKQIINQLHASGLPSSGCCQTLQ